MRSRPRPQTGKAYWAWFTHETGPYHWTCYAVNSATILKAFKNDPKFIGVTNIQVYLPTAILNKVPHQLA
jgi:hypothetical protein